MDDKQKRTTHPRGPWADYITWAARRAGSVDALAERSGLHRVTLSSWKTGRVTADNVALKSIRAVAAAVGDDPANALRAAGRITADQPPPSPPPVVDEGPSLADQLARVTARIEAIAASSLPFRDKTALIWEQQAEADRITALYLAKPDDGDQPQQLPA